MDITPSTEEIAHSQLLAAKIKAEIEAHQGSISFAKYMELALYAPGLGYYAAGATKLGKQGDFTTAPEISPLFGATIVQTFLPVLEKLQAKGLPLQILEFGAGSGALAESILNSLSDSSIKIDSYNILDLSADLIDRQQQRLHGRPENIQWLSELPSHFVGIIIANEVLDAMPVDLITKAGGRWQYQHVCLDDENKGATSFKFCDGSVVPHHLLPSYISTSDPEQFIDGYTTEIHPNGSAWINSLSQVLQEGLFLTFDYGFPAHEYYHSQRNQGTIMGHYRHHAIQDPFYFPGLCDLTAHVEWSTLTKCAVENGFEFLGYTNQASYLLDAGIGELALSYADPRDPVKFMPVSNGLQKLLSEAEMGELFKVLALGKNLKLSEGELPGFRARPRAL
jgi:SAM-dependent MidA family methyltransferase